MVDVRKKVEEITPEITQMRVHIHENPELSMKEYNTCALLEDYVKKNVKYDRLKRVGETGQSPATAPRSCSAAISTRCLFKRMSTCLPAARCPA